MTFLGPTAEAVKQRLMARIASGELAPGARLGGERDLASDLEVSRGVVRDALRELERSGVVVRVPGRSGGTFVARAKVDRDLSKVVGVPTLLREQGFTAGTRVLGASVGPAAHDVALALDLCLGDLVIDLLRIRLADSEPISLEHAFFPAHRFPGMLERPLGNSVYDMLAAEYDTSPDDADEVIEAVGAPADVARILDVAVGAPLLSVTRTTRDRDGVAFEYSRDLFRADRTRIHAHTAGASAAAEVSEHAR